MSSEHRTLRLFVCFCLETGSHSIEQPASQLLGLKPRSTESDHLCRWFCSQLFKHYVYCFLLQERAGRATVVLGRGPWERQAESSHTARGIYTETCLYCNLPEKASFHPEHCIEAEAQKGRRVRSSGHPQLHSEFEVSLGNMRVSLKMQSVKAWNLLPRIYYLVVRTRVPS